MKPPPHHLYGIKRKEVQKEILEEDKFIFVDGKNQFPSFVITSKLETKQIIIDLVESEWTSYEEMLSQNAIVLLRAKKYVNQPLNDDALENLKSTCVDTMDRAIKLGFIYFNESLQWIRADFQGKWSTWPRKY